RCGVREESQTYGDTNALATTIVAVFLAAGRLLRCLHLFLSDFSETS
ncbi:MAG: hypothetical protein RLZZ03_1118, partial [Pseudomonadota bacterium]